MSPGSRHPRLNTAQHRIWSFPTSRTAAKPRSVVDFQIQDTAHSKSVGINTTASTITYSGRLKTAAVQGKTLIIT